MSGPSTSRVHAVVVTYQPEMTVLSKLLDSLAAQAERLFIVDNTPGEDRLSETLAGAYPNDLVQLIRLGRNTGIGYALNVGIAEARKAGATHVLLSDQDSLPAADMVDRLLHAAAAMAAMGRVVGAVGPTYTDIHTGITYPFQVERQGRLFYGHQRPSDEQPIVQALTLITSGTLVPMHVLDVIGPMREDFFIDQVDIEWCHRARAKGFELFGVGNAVMFHQMGEHALRVWYFGWRKESAYSPLRVYYRIRNFVALCREKGIPLGWKLRSSWYSAGFVYSQVIFGRQRVAALRMALMGLWDGVVGRMGSR